MKQKTYLVTYSVTRSETYRVEAASRREAEDEAFHNGELIDAGEAFNAEPLACDLCAKAKGRKS